MISPFVTANGRFFVALLAASTGVQEGPGRPGILATSTGLQEGPGPPGGSRTP